MPPPTIPSRRRSFLDWIEWAGNKLPDPVFLFILVLLLTWVASAVFSTMEFSEIDPRTIGVDEKGQPKEPQPIRVQNQLSGKAMTKFLSGMVTTFTSFPPLGLVLVAMLGVGVAEHTGFVNALLKAILRVTPTKLLTPMVLLVAIISHSAGDSGYVLVVPLGGIIFAAAGRHPLAGIVTAFAGVAGGFSANFLPSGLDPLLQGFTQSAAQIIDVKRQVNPLCNWYFTAASCLIIVCIGWFVTDRIIEPRLRSIPVTDRPASASNLGPLTSAESRGLFAGLAAIVVGVILLVLAAAPSDSPLRAPDGSLAGHGSALMNSIVPLIFLLFLIPGILHGYIAGTVKSHRDVVEGMKKSMEKMSYYMVMAFFAALFTYAFRESNLGTLLAVKGAGVLKHLELSGPVTMVGIILLTTILNLLIGSASAKWALLAPIFVPMMMQLGYSPELTQAAFRVGDSSTNIITPLLPYFPLVLDFCREHVKGTGIGSLISLMLPYSLCFLVGWTILLIVYWQLGLPLGLQASYTYP